MKTRHVVLAGGLTVSAFVAVLGDRSASSEVVSATHGDAPGSAPTSHKGARPQAQTHPNAATSNVMSMVDRAELAKTEAVPLPADNVLFAARSWAPPPPTPAAPEKPSAPPLPFSYLGKEFDGSQWRVFLARQNAVLIVKANDVIEDTYRIERISPPIMTVLYLPLNESQQLSIQ